MGNDTPNEKISKIGHGKRTELLPQNFRHPNTPWT